MKVVQSDATFIAGGRVSDLRGPESYGDVGSVEMSAGLYVEMRNAGTPLTKADLRRMNRIRRVSKLARRCAARGRG